MHFTGRIDFHHGLVDMIALDSKGNIYTGEVFAGERVQRFVPPK